MTNTYRAAAISTVLLALATPLAACGESAPSVTFAQREFERKLKTEIGTAPFVVENFAKMNGQAREAEGVANYVMWYSATVRFPQGVRPECVATNPNQFMGFNCMNVFGGMEPLPRGASKAFDGQILFTKSEQGWLVPSY